MSMRAAIVVMAMVVPIFGADAAHTAAAGEFVRRVEETGVWSWDTRFQRLDIVHEIEGERWPQAMTSFERWAPGGVYGHLSAMTAPPMMADTRLLGLWYPGGQNNRWMYIPGFRRPRRLPPIRMESFLGNVFRALGLLQELPFRLRSNDELRLRCSSVERCVLTVPPSSVWPETVELGFEGLPPLLRTFSVKDPSAGGYRGRLGDYVLIGGIPTPTSIRAEAENGRRRTRVRFRDIAYDRPVGSELFSVARFGDVALPHEWSN